MARVATRQIGPWGTVARATMGTAAVTGALLIGVSTWQLAAGLLGLPALFTVGLSLRGARASPLRLHALSWHLVNISIGFVILTLDPASGMLFYGASMLVAAWRGLGACELFAVPNLVLRRDDQMACPVFLPVDLAEARVTGRRLYCS